MTGQPVIILLRPWNGVKAILSQRPTQSAFRPELVGMGKPTQPGYQSVLRPWFPHLLFLGLPVAQQIPEVKPLSFCPWRLKQQQKTHLPLT